MTANDFQHLADEQGQLPIPFTGSFDEDFCRGFMDALIGRWFTVDPDAAVAGILAIEKKLIIGPGSAWAGKGQFSAALARVRPELLLDVSLKNGSWDPFDPDIGAAFTMLGERDPAAARAFLERITDPDRRRSAETNIACGIATGDPLAGVALARSLGDPGVFDAAITAADRIGSGVLRQALIASDRKFPKGLDLAELILRHPDEDWAAITRDGPGGIWKGSGGEFRPCNRRPATSRMM